MTKNKQTDRLVSKFGGSRGPRNETIVLPLYFTGLAGAASITREGQEETRQTHQLDARSRALLSYDLPAYGVTWFLVEPVAQRAWKTDDDASPVRLSTPLSYPARLSKVAQVI